MATIAGGRDSAASNLATRSLPFLGEFFTLLFQENSHAVFSEPGVKREICVFLHTLLVWVPIGSRNDVWL